MTQYTPQRLLELITFLPAKEERSPSQGREGGLRPAVASPGLEGNPA
jgi:hypothetical protein